MLNRRSFLLSLGTIALNQLLSGCGDSENGLDILLLKGSIPPQLLRLFRQQLSKGQTLSLKPQADLKELFKLLETWHQKDASSSGFLPYLPLVNPPPPPISDLVTLGDSWLTQAIKGKLIQPFDIGEIPGWQQLPPRWQSLVRRDNKGKIADNGQIWAVPYRWGTTLIVYDENQFQKLGWTPTDWSDLWREELRDRIAIIDQPREVIGLTLKKLGQSYNTPNLRDISDLKSELFALQKQVKYYSNKHYLQPLLVEDVWLSVGWSTDILPLLTNNRNLKAVIPQSGTAIWSDLWVKPSQKSKNSQVSDTTKKWIDFCWQPQSVNLISLFTDGTSPMIYQTPEKDIDKEVRKNPLLLINKEISERSEFIYPLSKESQKQYDNLWKEMRNS